MSTSLEDVARKACDAIVSLSELDLIKPIPVSLITTILLLINILYFQIAFGSTSSTTTTIATVTDNTLNTNRAMHSDMTQVTRTKTCISNPTSGSNPDKVIYGDDNRYDPMTFDNQNSDNDENEEGFFEKLSKAFLESENKQDAIYGKDNRMEAINVKHKKLFNIAKSTAVQISNNNISEKLSNPSLQSTTNEINSESLEAILLGKPLTNLLQLCPQEIFAKQYSSGKCSGFLVAPDIIATAGHCVSTPDKCTDRRWVFDYLANSKGISPKTTKRSNIYKCKEILLYRRDKDQASVEMYKRNNVMNPFGDYALVKLDRPVTDRQPLKVRLQGKIEDDASLVIIGNPLGLPTKIAPGGKVINNEQEMFFTTSLDSFAGNSGSAVVNLSTYEVEGILSRGDDDFVMDEANSCRRYKVCEDGECSGEAVSRITSIPDLAHFLK